MLKNVCICIDKVSKMFFTTAIITLMRWEGLNVLNYHLMEVSQRAHITHLLLINDNEYVILDTD